MGSKIGLFWGPRPQIQAQNQAQNPRLSALKQGCYLARRALNRGTQIWGYGPQSEASPAQDLARNTTARKRNQ